MPRVKIDYVVSFSSEDPENPANNLLAWELGKKQWLCRAGESSCSVVLQLARAVQICAVHIGVQHAAFVEVLVGRSESPNDPFEVLVPRCVVATPAESRGAACVRRVRSFSRDQLAAARAHTWDRLRVVCSQPYNKHCQYGVTFVHVFEPEAEPRGAGPDDSLSRLGRLAAPDPGTDSDDDRYRPGQLFAASSAPAHTAHAQIRQATSQLLKNLNDSSTKLVKTPIAKASTKRRAGTDDAHDDTDRRRETLIYTDDDERPHAKIDRVVQRHRDEKNKDGSSKEKVRENTDKRIKIEEKTGRTDRKDKASDGAEKRSKCDDGDEDSGRRTRLDTKAVSNERDGKKTGEDRKVESGTDRSGREEQTTEFGSILRGVVVVFSGYVNPQRAQLRRAAVGMGARVLPDWGPAATHLVCAFPRTPKLAAARAQRGGAVRAATAAWVQQCAARRRRLPWRWFATDPADRQSPADTDLEDSDTDDEIERVMRDREGKASPLADSEPDTEREGSDGEQEEEERDALPALFAGRTFALGDSVRGDAGLAARLARYVAAYGGLLLEAAGAGDEADYVLCAGGGDACAARGTRVRADWVWRCHRARIAYPLAEYRL